VCLTSYVEIVWTAPGGDGSKREPEREVPLTARATPNRCY
jgi:hypothetical protein